MDVGHCITSYFQLGSCDWWLRQELLEPDAFMFHYNKHFGVVHPENKFTNTNTKTFHPFYCGSSSECWLFCYQHVIGPKLDFRTHWLVCWICYLHPTTRTISDGCLHVIPPLQRRSLLPKIQYLMINSLSTHPIVGIKPQS